jgi:hypothetical protein
MMFKAIAVGLSIGLVAVLQPVKAQDIARITLLPQDRALIGNSVVSAKDVVTELSKLHCVKTAKTMVVIRARPKAVGSFQMVAKALQDAKSVVVIDDNSGVPDAAICSR